jgi:hypothetical protein
MRIGKNTGSSSEDHAVLSGMTSGPDMDARIAFLSNEKNIPHIYIFDLGKKSKITISENEYEDFIFLGLRTGAGWHIPLIYMEEVRFSM